jgi:hypothetical protein
MIYLFLDNFRGFSNSLIPIADVNFLVGENSTGKTSLLTMIQMFTGPQLFMGREGWWSGDSISFRHFDEIVSAHSKNKSYFRLGYLGQIKSETKRGWNGILITYYKIDGLSQVGKVTITTKGDGDITLAIENNRLYYKKSNALAPVRTINEIHERLAAWATLHASPIDESWNEIKDWPITDGLRRLPFFIMYSLVSRSAGLKDSAIPAPAISADLVWIAPIRSKPRRTYDEPEAPFSSEGSHIPYVIRRMLNSKKDAIKFKEFIEQIGHASGLFQKIEIHSWGDSDISPFEVDAYLDDTAMGLGWLGYGVSQSLPVFVEVLQRPRQSWFAIQQPEVHLHPRAQACLGDVFFEMAVRDEKKFIIETHSDFMIDRFRLNYRKQRSKKNLPEAQILFFERHDKHNTVTPLPIGRHGELPSEQPEGYREFFIKEEMRILGI